MLSCKQDVKKRQAYQLEGVILIQDQILLFILEEMCGRQKGELLVGS